MKLIKIMEIVCGYSKKRDYNKFIDVLNNVTKQKMVNQIPKGLKTKQRDKLVEDEFLIKEGKNLIISGGGRIAIWLILENGLDMEIKKFVQFRNYEGVRQIAYLIRKLNYFKLKIKDFDKNKVISPSAI